MANNILRFPKKALSNVCFFLNDEALMKMRQISKATKKTVDNIYCTRDLDIKYMEIHEFCEKISLNVAFKYSKQALLWKFSVISSDMGLDICLDDFEFSTSNEFDITCESIDDFITLLAYLKWPFQNTKIRTMSFKKANPKTIRAFLNLHGEIIINKAEILPRRSIIDETFYTMLRRCEVENVFLKSDFSSIQYCYNSILRIASIVGKITIRVERRNSPKLPISFIHDVLNCECKELCIMNWDATYSLQEMFELVQIFHTLDKKVHFTAQKSDASERDDIIGLYTLCGRGPNFNIIHVDA